MAEVASCIMEGFCYSKDALYSVECTGQSDVIRNEA